MVIKQLILHSKFCPTACVDIAFQEQRGECLLVITTVYTDRTGKKTKPAVWWEEWEKLASWL